MTITCNGPGRGARLSVPLASVAGWRGQLKLLDLHFHHLRGSFHHPSVSGRFVGLVCSVNEGQSPSGKKRSQNLPIEPQPGVIGTGMFNRGKEALQGHSLGTVLGINLGYRLHKFECRFKTGFGVHVPKRFRGAGLGKPLRRSSPRYPRSSCQKCIERKDPLLAVPSRG